MWCDFGAMGVFGWTMMLLFWVAVIAVVVWLAQMARPADGRSNRDALAILQRRLAAGEIDVEEFEEIENRLTR